MILPLTDGLVRSNGYDAECAALADRHYSRQTIGARQFIGNGARIVLRDTVGSIVFVWLRQEYRLDGQQGYNCPIFRNESTRRSSDIILEAESLAVAEWGHGRAFTYVDPRKVGSVNPGYCFKMAGWRRVGKSLDGKHLLEKLL